MSGPRAAEARPLPLPRGFRIVRLVPPLLNLLLPVVVASAAFASTRSIPATAVVAVAALIVAGAIVRVDVLTRRAIASWPLAPECEPPSEVLPPRSRSRHGGPAGRLTFALEGSASKDVVTLRAGGTPVARLADVRAASFPDSPEYLRVHLESGTGRDRLPVDELTDAELVARSRRWRSRSTGPRERYAVSWWLPSGDATVVPLDRGRVAARFGETWCVARFEPPARGRGAGADPGLPDNHLVAVALSPIARATARAGGAGRISGPQRWLNGVAGLTDGLAILPFHVGLALVGSPLIREFGGRSVALLVVAAGVLVGMTLDTRARARVRRTHLDIRDGWRGLRVPWSSVTSVEAVDEAVVVRYDDGAPDAFVLEQPDGAPRRMLRGETDPERVAARLTAAWTTGRSTTAPSRRSYVSLEALLVVAWLLVLVATFVAGPA